MSAVDSCSDCEGLLSAHEIFMFTSHPDEHERGGIPEEFRPDEYLTPIPNDNGPGRVGYQWTGDRYPDYIGKAVVMVHEGPLSETLWVPCSAFQLYAGERCITPGVWYWLCLPMSPKNPAEEDWMRSISS